MSICGKEHPGKVCQNIKRNQKPTAKEYFRVLWALVARANGYYKLMGIYENRDQALDQSGREGSHVTVESFYWVSQNKPTKKWKL